MGGYLVLESENWEILNWLWKYINEKTDYVAYAVDYLNVGESMISKLKIDYFDNSENAFEYLNLVFGYYGKDKTGIRVLFIEYR